MDSTTHAANPFMMMTNPEVVREALERTERAHRGKGRICRPLDKPLIPAPGDEAAEFDRTVEGASG